MLVRAVDIGYRNTKYTVGKEGDGEIGCRMFTSVTSTAGSDHVDTGLTTPLDIRRIEVNGRFYDVGPDAHINMRRRGLRNHSEDYTETDQYLAQYRGALSYMDVKKIDLLVTGLPVRYMESKKEGLADLLRGEHPIHGGGKVEVGKVWVIEQPLGGFLDFAWSSKIADLTNGKTTNLLIDPGYFTLDWLVATGLKIHATRSDSCALGMSSVLKAIADEISRHLGVPYEDHLALDKALQTGEFRDSGRSYAIEPYKRAADGVIEEAINDLASSVGDLRMIDNVILVGGGAEMFYPAIKRRFKHRQVYKASDAIFANVRGFHRAGVMKAKELTGHVKAAV